MLLLDMDGTLICSRGGVPTPRPYLKQLLRFAFLNYDHVGIFTAAHPLWYDIVYRSIFRKIFNELDIDGGFHSVRTIRDCNVLSWRDVMVGVTKPLNRVWEAHKEYNSTNTLIVDDNKSTFTHPENGIHISEFDVHSNPCDAFDTTLMSLIQVLDDNIEHQSVHATIIKGLQTVVKSYEPVE